MRPRFAIVAPLSCALWASPVHSRSRMLSAQRHRRSRCARPIADGHVEAERVTLSMLAGCTGVSGVRLGPMGGARAVIFARVAALRRRCAEMASRCFVRGSCLHSRWLLPRLQASLHPHGPSASLALHSCSCASPASEDPWLIDISTGRYACELPSCLVSSIAARWLFAYGLTGASCAFLVQSAGASGVLQKGWGFFVRSRATCSGGKCITAEKNGSSLLIQDCKFQAKTHIQAWAFVSLTQAGPGLGHTCRFLPRSQVPVKRCRGPSGT